ncbi:unnamed protein product [Paramecium sonneborni]|uniref:Uncharacterized protein n=1 Tax=Paramecium sonneborni TaxID=65129 RepID=A0A8S1LLB1_9CILI|nr:unnamed protein product [Paramecium sonneborni]
MKILLINWRVKHLFKYIRQICFLIKIITSQSTALLSIFGLKLHLIFCHRNFI